MILNFLQGLEQVASLYGVLAIISGVIIGIFAGAIPGISPSMAVALLVPFSFGMDPAVAFILFVAVYQAANYGGSVTAITINAPGTASAVVTAIEGYEMQKKGRGAEALAAALCSSVVGGIIGALVLMLFAIPSASFAVKFGPLHYFLLTTFGILTVIVFAGNKKTEATSAVLLGMLFATVGMDNFTGVPRFTFGIDDLLDGIDLIPAMIGLFALAEVFDMLKRGRIDLPQASATTVRILDYLKYKGLQLKSAIIGTIIGVLPGAGATVASFISYNEAKRKNKNGNFSSGEVEGIIASEAANSASVGGALIPLMALGIPGSATDAVLLGALTLHGLVAGPALFSKSPEIVYSIFISVLLANFVILFVGKALNKLWVKITGINQKVLAVLIIFLCIFGSYSLHNSGFDVYLCFAFGLLGIILKKYDLPAAALILGLVLGGIMEANFRRMIILY